MRHRVAVTGMGVVSPIGTTLETFRVALLAGRVGVGPVTVFDPGDLPTRFAAEVPLGAGAFRDRKIDFALRAAEEAMDDASLSVPRSGGGVSLGLGLELFALEDLVDRLDPDAPLPEALRDRLQTLQTPSDLCVHLISLRHGLDAPPLTHVSACAAGADAIGAAFRMIGSGRRRWALAGGSDSMINPLGLGGFCLIRALSERNEDPTLASRPFDRRRDGFVLGEGGVVVLVLERRDDALARGARIRAEVVGYGVLLDADHISRPDPEGRGAVAAMSGALADADLVPADVGCVSAHGTSTPLNDAAEARAIRHLLGEGADEVPVTAPKSLFGHLIAAAGAVEAAAAIVGLEERRVPPTANLDDPDPACRLDHVRGEARPWPHDIVLSNSFGFGGQNASLIFRRSDAAR